MDIAKELGAEEGAWTQKLSLYMPDKDKDGAQVADYQKWVQEAREVLSWIGRGSTALPPGDGTWEKESGDILWEKTTLVYCFVDPDRFEANITNLRTFLHRFGRETNQGEVVVEFDGRFYHIKKFEEQGGA